MTTGEVLRVRAAMKPISTVPRALRHRRRGDRRGRRRDQPAQRRVRGAGGRRGRRGDGGAGAGRRDAGEVRRRLGGRDRAATRGYLDAPRRSGDAVPTAGGARRPARRGQDHGRRRAVADRLAWRSATPTRTSRPTAGDASPTSSSTDGEARSARWSAAVAARARRARRRAGPRRRRGARPRRPARLSSARPRRRCSRLARGRPAAPSGSGSTRDRPLLAATRAAELRALLDERATALRARSPRSPSPPTAGRRASVAEELAAVRPARDARRPGSTVRRRRAVRRPHRHRRSAELARAARRAAGRVVVHPPSLAAAAGEAVETLRGRRGRRGALVVPDGEAAKTADGRRRVLGPRSAGGLHPLRRGRRSRRGSDHRPGRLRRRRPGCAGVRVVQVPTTCSAWSTPRSAARPASTPRAGKNLVGAFHPPAGCSATSTRSPTLPRRRARSRAGRGGQVRVHRRPGDPRPDRGEPQPDRPPGDRASWSSARCASRPRSVGRGPAREGPPRDPQLRPHPRPRDRAGRGLPLAARRGGVGRAGVRRRARPRLAGLLTPRRRRPAPPTCSTRLGLPTSYRRRLARRCSRRCGWTRRRAARPLRFVVLDGLGRPDRSSTDPDQAWLDAACEEVRRRA